MLYDDAASMANLLQPSDGFCVLTAELIDFKTRRVSAFRKNLVELAELELKHAKVPFQFLFHRYNVHVTEKLRMKNWSNQVTLLIVRFLICRGTFSCCRAVWASSKGTLNASAATSSWTHPPLHSFAYTQLDAPTTGGTRQKDEQD